MASHKQMEAREAVTMTTIRNVHTHGEISHSRGTMGCKSIACCGSVGDRMDGRGKVWRYGRQLGGYCKSTGKKRHENEEMGRDLRNIRR